MDSVGKNTNGKKKRCKRKEKGEGKIKRINKYKKDRERKQIWTIQYRPYLMYKGRYIASSYQAYSL